MFPADDVADVDAPPAEGDVVWTLPQAEEGVPNPRLALLGGGVLSAKLSSCWFFLGDIADDNNDKDDRRDRRNILEPKLRRYIHKNNSYLINNNYVKR